LERLESGVGNFEVGIESAVRNFGKVGVGVRYFTSDSTSLGHTVFSRNQFQTKVLSIL